MGPSALRYAGLDDRLRRLGCEVEDYGNIIIPVRDTLPPEGGLKFLPAVVQAGEIMYQAGQEAIAAWLGCPSLSAAITLLPQARWAARPMPGQPA